MEITIPYCHLPNSKVQVFDMNTCKRSLFQIEALKAISEREDFAYFVTCRCTEDEHPDKEVIVFPEFDGNFATMWFDKGGNLHAALIRCNIIQTVSTQRQMKPEPLDSPVYTSRCK